ncbi:sulfotransferase family protein [Nocardioides kribbensis]|uniref:Sulfotransferase family protein n=2 Tax=Nocardioides kribbensis TaxID=305517 RepID=A0ABV1P3L3_9ACTN
MSSETPGSTPTPEPGSDPAAPVDAADPLADAPPVPRRIVFVVGSGRSGTSTMAGTLQALGMHVPQPEVVADETNPKGFGEPQWVVDFHDELLKRCNVQVSDGRPSAWFESGKLATFGPLRTRLHTWLEEQFVEGGPELVVKDPRMAWFLGLWRAAALRCDATPAYVTMLRPPTEVVGSKQKYYSSKFGEISRTAAWVNMMLHTERSTRGSVRAFVRYGDLLQDWTVPVFGVGQRFDLDAVKSASANDIRAVHQFIDPSLRRVQLTWDDVEVPRRLREIAQESWLALDRLADDDGDVAATHERLDELRAAYAELYDESAAIAESAALAARREALAKVAPPQTSTAAGGGRVDKVPHKVRALVPPSVRRGLRKAAGRSR